MPEEIGRAGIGKKVGIMTKTTIWCDLCRQPIEADRHLLRVESGSLRDRRPEIDLCRACLAAMLAWLEKGANCE